MEPAAENKVDFNSSLRSFLHHSRSQESHNVEGLSVGMDKFWEGQWPSLLKDWADFSRQAQVMDQNIVQSCDSPPASGSPSSLSTRDSSFFSWSEGSYSAAKHMLHSPEMLSSRFSGFSLFNPGVNHLDFGLSNENLASRDESQDGYALHTADMLRRFVNPEQSTCDRSRGNVLLPEFECDRDDFTKEGQSNAVKDHLDDGWASDTSASGSWASVSSQEFRRRNSCNEADDMHRETLQSECQCPVLTSSSHIHTSKSLLQAELVCLKPAQRLLSITTELPESDLDTNQNQDITEACNGVSHAYPYKEITLSGGDVYECDSCFLEKNDGDCACSANAFAHCSDMVMEKSYVAAPHQLSNGSYLHYKGYAIRGSNDSVRADNVVRLPHGPQTHLLPTLFNTVVPNSLQPNSLRKASYSAAIKERFASSTRHGYLRFAEQGGSPCYSFFLDDSDEVLFSRASRQERKSNKENCEWTYSFHCKKDIGKVRGAWKGWLKKENLASDILASMRVSGLCHLKAKSNQKGCAKETRFVLYYGGGQQQVVSQGAASNNKMRGQPLKPVYENTSSVQAVKIKEVTEPCIIKAGNVKITAHHSNGIVDRSNRSDARKEKSGQGKLKPNCSQQAELAAIIINTSTKEKKTTKRKEDQAAQKDATGWGIKFLEKGTASGWGLSFMEKTSSNSRGLNDVASYRVSSGHETPACGDPSTEAACGRHLVRPHNDKDSISTNSCPDLAQKLAKKMNTRKNRIKVDVTVILPAGDHGLPDDDDDVSGPYGPTPLLERWISGGDCACGGWDEGCGLSVFRAETLTLCRSTANIALTTNDRMNWLCPGNPFKLFTQGYNHKKVLVLEVIESGLFSMSFQARFSPVQAFAIAVALFHQQMTYK